jgi:hypothetical protein
MVSDFRQLGDEMKKTYKTILISLFLIIFVISFSACGSKKNNTVVKDESNITSKDNTTEKSNEDIKESAPKENLDKNEQGVKNQDNDEVEKLDIKALEKNKVRIFSENALFGATVTIKINDKSIEGKSVFYQVFNKSEPLTKQFELSKSTTMYPVAKVGTKVQVKFYDKNKKLLFSEDAIIENK